MAVDGWNNDEGAVGGFKKTGPNPTDRGKQGVKRSLLTEAAVPVALAIEGANRHDMKLVRGHFGRHHDETSAAQGGEAPRTLSR